MPASGSVAVLSNWTSTASAPRSRWELAAVVFVSMLVHGGIAGAAYADHDAPRTQKRVTRVQIDMARPALPPRPVVSPPEPPKAAKQVPKPLAALPKSEPVPTPSPAPVAPAPESPVVEDTGSSAPAAADGELFAGSGGLGTAAPPAPPAPVQAPPRLAPVIQAREGANYLKNPRPAYPGRARREGWQGTTVLRVQVSPSGRPGAIHIQKSSGRQVLDDAATEAVKRWSFTPASQGGSPISGWVTVPIVFKLQ